MNHFVQNENKALFNWGSQIPSNEGYCLVKPFKNGERGAVMILLKYIEDLKKSFLYNNQFQQTFTLNILSLVLGNSVMFMNRRYQQSEIIITP